MAAYFAPATSKIGPLKLRSRKSPEDTVATPIMAHRTASYGRTHTKEMGMKMLSA